MFPNILHDLFTTLFIVIVEFKKFTDSNFNDRVCIVYAPHISTCLVVYDKLLCNLSLDQ